MTDDERTEAAIAFHQELALLRHRQGRLNGEASPHCEECGGEIPQERRRALPNVRLCVGCKAAQETRGRQWADT